MKFFVSIVKASLSVVLFSVLLFFGYIVYLNFFASGFLFYDGLIGLCITFILILVVILLYAHKQNKKDSQSVAKELFLGLLSGLFLVYSFHITFPTVINRGISLYVISRLDAHGGQKINAIRDDYLSGYVDNYSTVCRRIDEQVSSGNVVFKDGRYHITQKGQRILSFLQGVSFLTGQSDYYIKETGQAHPPLHYDVRNGQCRRVE